MDLTISGYSTALFATWYFIEELGLLLDCGDGVMAALLQKSRKVDHVFISHADRDHLTGLLQFNQLNARPGFPMIHYPKDCGSFAALREFSTRFDPHVGGAVWQPVVDKERVWIRKDVYVVAVKNNHVAVGEGVYKSLGYQVVQVRQKLKPELAQLPPMEIKKTIATLGKEASYTTVETKLLSYSGDTPVENFEFWDGSGLLIHEATFLGGAEDKHIHTHGNRHSTLPDVLSAVARISIGKLVLGHFSPRYSAEQIDGRIVALCREYGIGVPVYRLLPGAVVMDVLGKEPVYMP